MSAINTAVWAWVLLREDTHKKSVFFSCRTTKIWVPPPLDLIGSNHFFLQFFYRFKMDKKHFNISVKFKFENIIFSDSDQP